MEELRRDEARAGARGTKSRPRKRRAVAPLPGQSSTSPLEEGELWFGRGALRNAREAEIRTYGSSVCFSQTKSIYIVSVSPTLVHVASTDNMQSPPVEINPKPAAPLDSFQVNFEGGCSTSTSSDSNSSSGRTATATSVIRKA